MLILPGLRTAREILAIGVKYCAEIRCANVHKMALPFGQYNEELARLLMAKE